MPQRPAPGTLSFILTLMLTCAAVASSEKNGEVNSSRASLRIAGSDSMGPLLEALETQLGRAAPGFRIEIDERGSSTGPPALLRGEADLASMTRPLGAIEQQAFRARYGRTPIAFAVALDAIAVYVNAASPLIRISLEQIDAAFSAAPRCGATSVITRWGELGVDDADYRDRQIGIYAPPAASGTRTLFRQTALCGARLRDQTRQQPGTRSVTLAIAASRYAIGFGTLAGASPEIRALALPLADSDAWSGPTPEAVRSRRYPFSRELLFYALPDENGGIDERVRTLLELVLSEPGGQIIESKGFLALPQQRLREERARLDALPEAGLETFRP